jgi:hypothetical protein
MRRYVIVSDLQVPFERRPAVTALARFIEAWQPDEVLCVGDLCDFPSLSRWHRGLRGEYDVSLHDQRERAIDLLQLLDVKHLMRSNHDDRLELYLRQKAPALEFLPELKLEAFLRLDEIGVKFHRKPYEFSPGWWLMHGDEGGLSSDPGKTAVGLARRIGANVVCGHTHRIGIQNHTEAVGGEITRTLTGFEVGCLMDLAKADYLGAGSANWQLGAGVLYVHQNGASQCVPLMMNPRNGGFMFEGKWWR